MAERIAAVSQVQQRYIVIADGAVQLRAVPAVRRCCLNRAVIARAFSAQFLIALAFQLWAGLVRRANC